MKVAYIDEAGTSVQEPVAVVAGLVVDGDFQWNMLAERLRQIKARYLGEQCGEEFVFHAKAIFAGTGQFADKEKWPRSKRNDFLKDVLSSPLKVGAPLVFGFSRRGLVPDTPLSPRMDELFEYLRAYECCLIAVERLMREGLVGAEFRDNPTQGPTPFQVACIVVEDRPGVPHFRRSLKRLLNAARKPDCVKVLGDGCGYFPLTRIIDTVSFAEKDDSVLLQFADACAFAVRRFLAKMPMGLELFSALSHDQIPEPEIDSYVVGYQLVYPRKESNDFQIISAMLANSGSDPSKLIYPL